MKSLFLGILLIIILGFGGLVYRNAVEHPQRPIACPLDAKLCPDGTSVARTGTSCTFPECAPPNVTLSGIGVSFAVPENFGTSALPDASSVAAYERQTASSTAGIARIIIRRFAIEASSGSTGSTTLTTDSSPQATALATIEQTAIGGASGIPVSATSFTSTVLGAHRFTVVAIERFEGVVDMAYYLARGADVLRFDAIDENTDWTNPNLDVSALPAHTALRELLTTLQGE